VIREPAIDWAVPSRQRERASRPPAGSVTRTSCRRVPYRGIGRNDLWWSLRVAAVNLRRLLVLGLPGRRLGAGLTG
jgi:hypothetical protein